MNAASSSQTHADFLVELGTEELPPTALKSLSNAFTQAVLNGLTKAHLSFETNKVESFATPRRLAIFVPALQIQQADRTVEKLGPAVKAAYDKEGNPSKAAEGFARSNGVAFSELTITTTDKGERLCFSQLVKGAATASLLEKIIGDALATLPIPKRMRWGSSRAEFVRPAHWLVVLLGNSTVDCRVLGIQSSNVSFGHRFHCTGEIIIPSAGEYENTLADKGQLVASFDQRKAMITTQVETIAKALGGKAVIENDLLEEVTALVEKPVALAGSFDAEFLSVPNEALIYSMSEHQKYFHVVDADGKLLPNFITVSNIQSKDPSKIVSGNERVIRPRLADAAFFFETDKKHSLTVLRERLKSVVFQKQLGTVFEKTQRIASLAGSIAEQLGKPPQEAIVAGEFSKADLASDMVLEFDKMQGVAGGYYALHDGLSNTVAEAIRSHYLPRFAGDKVPSSNIACAVALADRLDTLTGIFGIGQEPSGSKDPFALRRSAIGILQIILQNELSLNLRDLVKAAVAQHVSLKDKAAVTTTVVNYIFDRFAALYQEQGYSTEVFLAVRAIENFDALDFNARIQAVAHFVKQTESESLASANKRVSNILEKSETSVSAESFDPSLLVEDAEKVLAEVVAEKEAICTPLFAARQYQQGLLALTALKDPVDRFFDSVMVNTDDEAIKHNRLALLAKLRALFLKTADISLLVIANKV